MVLNQTTDVHASVRVTTGGLDEVGGVSLEGLEHEMRPDCTRKNLAILTVYRKASLLAKTFLTGVRFDLTVVNRRNEPC